MHISERTLPVLPFGWGAILKNKNFIWISLNKTGRMPQNKEMFLSVLSTVLVESKYRVDSNRVYLSSLTQSCFPASAAMEVYPAVFNGAIYTTCTPINWRGDLPASIEQMKKNRYVFVSGANQDLEREMRRISRKYKDAGLENVEYMNIPHLRYGKNLSRRKLEQSIEFLDIRD